MEIINEILATLDYDAPVREIRQGPFQTAVLTRGCGLASTPHDPGLYGGAAAYPAPGVIEYPTSPTPENELSFLKSQADLRKQEMAEIERRIQGLEKKNQQPRSML